MPIAVLNRQKLQELAATRMQEAKLLLESGLWTGSYYLTGLGVECALKACLAKSVQQHDFPDKRFINQMYTHELDELAGLIEGPIWIEMKSEMDTDLKLKSNWNTVRQWEDEKRYESVLQIEAESLFPAVTEPVSGVMDWIRRRW